jgi:hypothetical protein
MEKQPLRALPEAGRQSNVPVREEVQVEAILQTPAVSPHIYVPPADLPVEISSSEPESDGDDDDTAQMLRKTSEMVRHSTQLRSQQSALTIAEPPPSQTPSESIPGLGLSSTLNARINIDSDATPNARVRIGARKRATTRFLSEMQDEDTGIDDEDEDESVVMVSTDSSIPAMTTQAHEYVVAQAPFTPAHGTKAEERVHSEKTSRKKGKGRAM